MNNKKKFWRVNILSFILRIAWLDVLLGRKCHMEILYDSTISNQYFWTNSPGPQYQILGISHEGFTVTIYHTWISHKFNWIQYKDFWPKSCMTLTSNRKLIKGRHCPSFTDMSTMWVNFESDMKRGLVKYPGQSLYRDLLRNWHLTLKSLSRLPRPFPSSTHSVK